MKRSSGQTNSPLFFSPGLGDTPLLGAFLAGLSFGSGLVGFWFPNVRTIQPLGTHARMLAETALIADSLQLDTFVHSAWRTPVVLPSAVDDRRDFGCRAPAPCVSDSAGVRSASGNASAFCSSTCLRCLILSCSSLTFVATAFLSSSKSSRSVSSVSAPLSRSCSASSLVVHEEWQIEQHGGRELSEEGRKGGNRSNQITCPNP